MARERRGTEMATWRPVRDIDRVFDEMEETFEDVFGRPFYPVAWARTPEIRAWSPPMEIYEDNDSYTVRLELPGVNKDDINVSATEDTVTISGERKAPEQTQEQSYSLCERCYGSFERTITFPAAVNSDNIEANFDNGILELKIPKSEQAVGKKVEIMAGGGQQQLGQGQQARMPGHTAAQMQGQQQPRVQRGTPEYREQELQEQQNLKESQASAATEREAVRWEQTGNPAMRGSDVHGELPGQTGTVAEENRSGNVRVVTPGQESQGRGSRGTSRNSQGK